MKYFCYLVLAFCMQGLVLPSRYEFVNLEFNSFYFDKGVSSDFYGAKIDRLVEIQKAHSTVKWEFVLVQLKSEPKSLVSKRLLTLRKRFEEGGLDMNRIVFNTTPILVDNLQNHYPPDPPKTLKSVGAILEGKVLSLE
ncbi:MAG: hypothetical protein ACO1N0_05260 [Fluviicola sp.]